MEPAPITVRLAAWFSWPRKHIIALIAAETVGVIIIWHGKSPHSSDHIYTLQFHFAWKEFLYQIHLCAIFLKVKNLLAMNETNNSTDLYLCIPRTHKNNIYLNKYKFDGDILGFNAIQQTHL